MLAVITNKLQNVLWRSHDMFLPHLCQVQIGCSWSVDVSPPKMIQGTRLLTSCSSAFFIMWLPRSLCVASSSWKIGKVAVGEDPLLLTNLGRKKHIISAHILSVSSNCTASPSPWFPSTSQQQSYDERKPRFGQIISHLPKDGCLGFLRMYP